MTQFRVTLFDSGNNQRSYGGDQLNVVISPSDGSVLSQPIGIEVFDNNDGTYDINYKVLESTISYLITVTVNSITSSQITSNLIVGSNYTSPEVSTI